MDSAMHPGAGRQITLYFDPINPYVWLARKHLARLEAAGGREAGRIDALLWHVAGKRSDLALMDDSRCALPLARRKTS